MNITKTERNASSRTHKAAGRWSPVPLLVALVLLLVPAASAEIGYSEESSHDLSRGGHVATHVVVTVHGQEADVAAHAALGDPLTLQAPGYRDSAAITAPCGAAASSTQSDASSIHSHSARLPGYASDSELGAGAGGEEPYATSGQDVRLSGIRAWSQGDAVVALVSQNVDVLATQGVVGCLETEDIGDGPSWL